MAKAFYEIWKTDNSFAEEVQQYAFKEVNIKREMMKVSSFYFSIERNAYTELTAPKVGDKIKIIRNNTVIFHGKIDDMEVRENTIFFDGRGTSAIWQDYVKKTRLIYNAKWGTATNTWQVVNDLAYDVGWTLGTVSNFGFTSFNVDFQDYLDRLIELSAQHNTEFMFDDVRQVIDFGNNIGTDKSSHVRLQRGVNLEEISVNRTRDESWDYVIALGAGDGHKQLVAYAGDYSKRTKTKVVTDKEIKTQADLQRYADQTLAEGSGTETISFSAKMLSPIYDFGIGDKIWVEDEKNRIDEPLKVYKVEVTFNETEQFNIELANKNKTLIDFFKRMEKGQRTLENVHHSSAVQPNSMIVVDEDTKDPILMQVENDNFVNTTTGNTVGTIENNVSTAQSTATSAQGDASNALTVSGLANQKATNADTKAGQAQTDADNAVTTANDAKAVAEQAQADASQAQTNATNAQTIANSASEDASTALSTANSVNSTVSDLSSDSKLTPSEKQLLKKEMDIIDAEEPTLEAQADAYGVTKTSYVSYYNTLSSYMSPLLTDLNSTSNVTGSTLRTRFKDYYNGKTDLLNSVADKAKEIANSAKGVADDAVAQASSAESKAGQAQTDASSAISTANSASSSASSAVTTANSASSKADSAVSTASNADTKADSAVSTANTASSTANTADSKADDAKADASNAVSTASSADSKAGQAQLDASSAVTTASNAEGKADDAVSTANTASSTANTAKSTADTAKSTADSAISTANTAKSTADSAISTANSVNSKVSDMANDNKLTPSEKQMIQKEWDTIADEKSSIESQGTAYGLTTDKSNYTSAYDSLDTYLAPLISNLTSTTNITGTTLRSKFKDYYSAKTTLLNSVADKAKTIADSASSTASSASSKADGAVSTANSASSTANSAKTTANSASSTANTAKNTADTANSTANTASTNASNAVSTANSASGKADDAIATANNAKSTADTAKSNADTANSLLADIASDSKLTPTEKIAMKKEWDAIVSEKSTLESQASSFGITTEKTNYTNAYNSLSSYVSAPLASLGSTSSITGSTLRSRFKTYYDSRTALLNKVSDVAKAKADSAQSTANTANGKADDLVISKVEKNGVVSAINQSPESVTIDANKVNLVGYTTFKSQSEISGNLLKDLSSFEGYAVGHDFPNRVGNGLSIHEVSNEFAYHGSKSLKTVNTIANSYIYPEGTGWYAKMKAGKKYIASIYVYTTSATPVSVQFSPMVKNSSNTTVDTSGYQYRTITKVDGWVRMSAIYTAPTSEDESGFCYYLRTNDASGYEVYWEAIQLEEVPEEINYPSPYKSGGFTTIDGDLIETGTLKWDKGYGGQLALGGVNNANGEMVILNDQNDPIAFLGAGTAGFGEIQADRLVGVENVVYKTSPYHPCYEDGNILVYVNGATGRNGAVGTKDDPFLYIQDAINSLPKYLEHSVQIRIFPMKYDERLVIEGFKGAGMLEIKTHMWGVQYIRDWSTGSTSNTGNHWVEIQAYSAYSGSNVALGKPVSHNGSNSSSFPVSRIVDGKTDDSGIYADVTATSGAYVEIDLESENDLYAINVWKYYQDRRAYKDMQTFVKGSGTNNEWVKIWDVDNWTGAYQGSSLGSWRHTFINGTINADINDRLHIRDITVDSRAYGSLTPIHMQYNNYVLLERVVTFTKSSSYNFYNYGSYARLGDCEGNGGTTAVLCSAYGASTDVFGLLGGDSPRGMFAYATGWIAGGGDCPNGTSYTTSSSSGGSVSGSFTGKDGMYTPYTAPPPPPPAKDVTKVFTSTSSKSWRENYGGQWYDTTVLQGEWSGWGLYRGYWFFGSQIDSAVKGKTIKRVRIYLTRSNESGNSGTVNAIIRTHSYTSQPSSSATPSYYGSAYKSEGFSWGQGKWIDVTSQFASYFNAGVRGIMLYTSSTSNSNYMRFNGSAKVEITYTE